MKKPAKSTTIQCQRASEFYQEYTRIDVDEDFYSKLKLTHIKQIESNKDYLEVNAFSYNGVLSKSFLCSCLAEMYKGLTPEQITSLKLIGVTNKNCEAELFRKSSVRSITDGSFANLREVVIESGYPKDMPDEIQPSTTLPSRPFMRADLDFLKIDGNQVIPDNFLTNATRVGMLICPDNNNTHTFLTSPKLDNVFATSQTATDIAQSFE